MTSQEHATRYRHEEWKNKMIREYGVLDFVRDVNGDDDDVDVQSNEVNYDTEADQGAVLEIDEMATTVPNAICIMEIESKIF
jgi:hypothetical protein